MQRNKRIEGDEEASDEKLSSFFFNFCFYTEEGAITFLSAARISETQNKSNRPKETKIKTRKAETKRKLTHQ